MRVEEIDRYGKPLAFPREVQTKQIGIVLSEMREEFGRLGMAPMFFRIVVEQRRLRRAHPDLVAEAGRIGKDTATELVLLTSLFNVTARREGREQAYEFLKRIFQRLAEHTMPAIYRVDELVKCDGDVFENFKEFNKAMFAAMHRQGTWKSNTVVDEGDRLRIRVVSCANVDLFTAIGSPELGRLACDHDLAGFPTILDRVDAEFRRPCTLAKSGDHCDFNFYRKGTAPPTEHLNK